MAALVAPCPHCNTEIRTILRAGPSGPPRIGAVGATCPRCQRTSSFRAHQLRRARDADEVGR